LAAPPDYVVDYGVDYGRYCSMLRTVELYGMYTQSTLVVLRRDKYCASSIHQSIPFTTKKKKRKLWSALVAV
jgi:hypothetical protein